MLLKQDEAERKQYRSIIEEKLLKTGEKDRKERQSCSGDISQACRNRRIQNRLKINAYFMEFRLKEHLRQRLIECGWKEDLKSLCKDVISKKGIESVSVDDLVHEISPKARTLVPDSIRNELLGKIKAFLKDQEA